MLPSPSINVIIPAYNEEQSIAQVVRDIPAGFVADVIVVNNNSTDSTAEVAAAAGATVLHEPNPGYGNACLKGIAYAAGKPAALRPDIIVFLDGDYSDYPEEMVQLVQPIVQGQADMVIGSRALGQRESGSMMPQQIFGNWLATTLIRFLYGARFTDLGPFRAIKLETLQALGMRDRNYGWTVEMQAKAAKQKVKYTELPVSYRRRIGVSKVSGTVKGTVMAGYKIILTIFRYL
ncbi:glycosyltransferase family 2 protein [Pontibacter chinhatensis]|uniref:Glycosyltransferase involved in cell wall bisynthesis n=1 Tax=Pontibacter chinhatensis TaxID=1436961 RepID=A0A1I2WNK6_9BACT|nr:glycosyltransferase family 2 protein [Pontibacter chinhatensis]SFH02913.1 Glycosyltransferase involved in cell wall bisynthesis [Pontibacter chinhatensis]